MSAPPSFPASTPRPPDPTAPSGSPLADDAARLVARAAAACGAAVALWHRDAEGAPLRRVADAPAGAWAGVTGTLADLAASAPEAQLLVWLGDGRSALEARSLTAAPLPPHAAALLEGAAAQLELAGQREALAVAEAERARLARRIGELESVAQVGSYEWDIPADRITWSDEQLRIHGLTGAEQPHSFGAFLEHVHPDDRDHMRSWTARLLSEGRVGGFPYRIVRPDGAARWLEARGELLRDAAGRPERLVGISRDISAQREAELLLRASEVRFRELFMQFPVSVQIFDLEGRTLQVNPAYTALWGLRLEDLRDFNPLTEPQLAPIRHLVERGFAGETVFLPLVAFDARAINPRADGLWPRWIEAFMFPVRDEAGAVREVGLVHMDVTERVRAEEALRTSEESYRAIFEAAGEAIYVIHPETGDILDVNPAACALNGRTAEELRATGIAANSDDASGHDDQRALELIHRVAAGEELRFDWVGRHSSGRAVPAELSAKRVTILGEPRVLVVARDITERRAAEAALRRSEDELRRANEALEQRVAARTAELVARTRELEGVLQALPDQYFRLREDGLILDQRAAAGVEDALALTTGAFLAPSLLSRLPREERPRVARALATTVRTGQLETVEYSAGDGDTAHDAEIRLVPIGDGTVVALVRDITVRKRAERELRRREAHFRRLIEYAHDITFIMDVSARFTYQSPSVERLLGYSPEELVDVDGFQFVHPDDRHIVAEAMQRVVEAPGTTGTARYRFLHKDGSWRYLETFGRTLLPDSAAAGIVGNARDITERVEVEAALRRSEEQFRRLVENTYDIITIIDVDGRIRYQSPAIQRTLGYTQEELVGRNSFEFVHPDDQPAVLEELQRSLAVPGTKAHSEYRFRRADGSWCMLETIGGTVLPDSLEGGIVFNSRDVTFRREAEEELRRSEERFRRVVESVRDVVFRTDAEGRWTLLNPAWEAITGWRIDESIGHFFLDVVREDDRDRAVAAFAPMVAGECDFCQVEMQYLTRDGRERWMRVHAQALRDDGGRLLGTTGTLADVTARREAERALAQAKEEAEQANRAKSEFLSRMSHELRTPLNSILGFAQLLGIADLAVEHRKGVQHILKAGRHLLQLINEVLEISRIEAGRQTFSVEPVDVRGVLQEAIALVRPLAEPRDVALFDLCAALDAHVQADRQRLVQVMLNLLSNAIKYNRPGGSVSVACDVVDDRAGTPVLVVRVEDTGRGIPSDRRSQLFTPFARLGAEQSAEEGTGLGLALSRRLAEAMGGTLELERSGPGGSVFALVLRLADATVPHAAALAGAAGALPAAGQRAATLLYVEDNLANLSLVEAVLTSRPAWRLIPALHGELGLELAVQHRPDVILLDLHLPDVGGEEVLRRLRADARTADVPVVVVSADATTSTITRLRTAGADAFLTKPLDIFEFVETVQRFVERSPRP